MECALESEKTLRARDKLKKRFEILEKKVTPEALQKKKMEMNLWLAKYATARIVVSNKLAKPSQSLLRRVTCVLQQSEKEKQVASKIFPML